MNPEELDKQFKALEGDKQVQAAAAGTPPAAAKKKRITVADLNKTMDELTELVNVDVFSWLEKLDTRVRHFENAEAEEPDSRIGELAVKLDILEENAVSDRVHVNKDILNRLEALEGVATENLPAFVPDINARLTVLSDAIGTLADAFRQHLEEVSGEQPAAAQEIEFAKPPGQHPAPSTRAGDIAAVASVCLTMNDVLTVTRALKESPGISDEDKRVILRDACWSAGVPITSGLQIRAGVLLGAV